MKKIKEQLTRLKSKYPNYVFTEDEILTLRNALIEYYQSIKKLKPNSPIAQRNLENTKVLKDLFIKEVI
jgi:hypothetical protein